MSDFIGSCLPIEQALKRFVEGLGIANSADNANKILMVSPGKITDSTRRFIIINDDALYMDITKKGAGGLDVGSPANNTMYALYIVADSKFTKPVSLLASLASNAIPYLPTEYGVYALIGYFSVNASTNIRPCTWTVERSGTRSCYYSGASVSLVPNLGTSGATTSIPNMGYYFPPIETVAELYLSVNGPADTGQVGSVAVATASTPTLGGGSAAFVISAISTQTVAFLQCFVKVELTAGVPTLYYKTSANALVLAGVTLNSYEFYI